MADNCWFCGLAATRAASSRAVLRQPHDLGINDRQRLRQPATPDFVQPGHHLACQCSRQVLGTFGFASVTVRLTTWEVPTPATEMW